MSSAEHDRQLKLHPFFLASARPGEEGRDLQIDMLLVDGVAKDAQAPPITADRLSTLPNELLWMIFGQMPPSSLLQASRVSKLFRRMLCSRSAETIWRRARLKEGWTDLETKGWNEIQYAKFIDGRECQICGKAASNALRIKRRLRLRACVCADCNLIRDGDDVSDDYPYLHPESFNCVPYDSYNDEFFIPDLLEQSGRLSLIQAKALRDDQSLGWALQDYRDSRESYLDMVVRDAEAHAGLCDDSDEEILRKAWRRYCVEQLAGLGYLPEDYAFLDDDDWWCSCAGHLGKDECLFEEAFEEAMDRRDGFNPEAVGDEEYDEILRLARTRHANYPQIPDVFWYYWEDEDDDGFGLDDDERSEDDEWCDLGDLYVKLSERNKEERLRRAQEAARQVRRQKLRPLFERIQQQTTQRQSSHFFSFWYFCVGLKSIERLWLPDAAAAQPAQPAPSPLIERFLVKDAADKAHEEKVRLFFRIARALLHDDDDENAALPESVTAMLEHVDSRVQDSKQSDVFRSYCLDILGDDEMDPIFARATALFRCGFCSSKFTYPDIANHLVEMHGAGPVTAYAHVPAPAFRRAVKDLLVEMKLPFTTTSSDLAEYRFDVDEESESDLAGKAKCDLPGKRRRRNVDGEKTERAIIAIRQNSVSSQNHFEMS
ncbi:hypothetical protein B0A53_01799 [Rhodotorula sp. CCFEE 5036]|nr:hypothetical protein B0A53_01799 [Rhodotorula sp. CCFEE 5036]